MFLKRPTLVSFLIAISFAAITQPKKTLPKDSASAATVNVTMTNSTKKPQKGEQIIFLAAG